MISNYHRQDIRGTATQGKGHGPQDSWCNSPALCSVWGFMDLRIKANLQDLPTSSSGYTHHQTLCWGIAEFTHLPPKTSAPLETSAVLSFFQCHSLHLPLQTSPDPQPPTPVCNKSRKNLVSLSHQESPKFSLKPSSSSCLPLQPCAVSCPLRGKDNSM